MANENAEVRGKLLDQLIEGKEEFCVICLKTLGFLKSLHVYAKERFENGASYSDQGGGQTCGDCNRSIERKEAAR
ncbi:MAG: hypothetical protein A3C93_01180 [Candidatus Lloydbacteria bacterium RIFCSPHIGHO2_02_FULL_54_17]|uniref:Uncharacterized protein n=1 Tax=Candidatus Lloydbacteria bacterium RIFCSPHIGHO2_02_FULL_54_17 TaxID=1798664 RepID=A0A1G2DEX8_9BACT|nr:MAG: hypothetical protein A3C93_01180 [Candidatus Lloydbacteria bacterium RIFCSPHIGHO2_02_FULL_54_17]OGZ14409.1 MAG: hypothetical protein A2948_00535 [Candidatus Lloydbacteria bacterium RIFCSPLOWO2_01_FULL_54_18]OGZ16798.1 MAG: hypothetical protein A3H76_02055 [Candidatus Lloydbacteria bacterium RIFCSPLOWO2_02_FULL_54_12]